MTCNPTQSPSRILIVSDDMTSHLYAVSKLACVCGTAGHQVTLATAAGKSHDLVVHETQAVKNVKCVIVGTSSSTKCLNEAGVTNPNSWKTFWQYLFHPFPFADAVPQALLSSQQGMYEPIKELIKNSYYDIIIPLHGMAGTVGDAVSDLGDDVDAPIIVFSSFPYDPFTYRGDFKTWFLPRTFSAYPHVGAYSAHLPKNIVRCVIQLFWQFLDGLVSTYMYRRSGRIANMYRTRRGLPPNANGYCGWQRRYPCICVGGVEPFSDKKSIATRRPQDTLIGALNAATNSPPVEMDHDLYIWLQKANNGIIYTSFGTGVELNEKEAKAVTGDLLRSLESYDGGELPILFALRPSEQKRLRPIFDAAIGTSPTSESAGHLEYLNGRLRIQVVPQAGVLKSGKVRVFISHVGFGGYSEGIEGGNVFICYPAFADQYFNAQRAVDAGIGVMAPDELDGVGDLVIQVLGDKEMAARAKDFASRLPDGARIAVEAIERAVMQSKNKATPPNSAAFIKEVPNNLKVREVKEDLKVSIVTDNKRIRRMSTASAGAA